MEFSTQQIGKFLILTGVFIALAGAVLMILGRTGLFKLPGVLYSAVKTGKYVSL
jgi:multisubunit Na+/H+ antiporter MnhG subunit